MITRVKGTQDFLDLRLFNWLISQVHAHLATANFTEIATPLIEHTQLFSRSLGLQTDVVSKEMFIIQPREGQEESICLRPEATASMVRAFVENHIERTPWKVYSGGPMFRYERPQKGRFRQFNQVTIEVIGGANILHDVQVITLLDRFFHEKLSINNYALLINFLGCFNDRQEYKQLLYDYLQETALSVMCENCIERKEKNIMRIFDCKQAPCQQIYKNAPFIADNLCEACEVEWQQLQSTLELLSISFVCQPTLVRGLDYYNKTVFEFASNDLGAQNAFCGGGRYDQLVSQLGGKQDQPCVGAAIGIERLLMILERQADRIQLPVLPALHVIMPFGAEQQALALLIADELQARGLCVQVMLDSDSFKSMMSKANKWGARFALLLGPDEQQAHQITVKHMVTGVQEKVAQAHIVDYLMGKKLETK